MNASFQFCAPRPLLVILPVLIAIALAGCSGGSKSQPSPDSSTSPITSAIPPFASREPERYRAVRVITTTQNTSETRTSTTLIARDGGNRREEYQSSSGTTAVYLENADGSFILNPTMKTYADVYQGLADQASASENTIVAGLDQARGEAQYEKLGDEQLGGRKTTKYRVTYAGGSRVDAETLLWIDEALGMPIRSETRSGGTENQSTVVMELREIMTDVDPTLFRLGPDYRRVDRKVLFDKHGK